MDKNTYKDFLHFLDAQKCRGLTITSCMAGGESSLTNIPSSLADPPHQFPVIVRSVGDFVTMRQELLEKDLDTYFQELATFIGGAQTVGRLRKAIQAAESRATGRTKSGKGI